MKFLNKSQQFIKIIGSPAKRAMRAGKEERGLGEGIFARPPLGFAKIFSEADGLYRFNLLSTNIQNFYSCLSCQTHIFLANYQLPEFHNMNHEVPFLYLSIK